MKSLISSVGLPGVLLVLALVPASASGQDLSASEVNLLPKMDSKAIAEVLDLAVQIDGWRKDIAQFRKALDKATKNDEDLLAAPAQAADVADAVLKIARRLGNCSPSLREQIGFDDKMSRLLKSLDGVAKIDISPDDFPDVDVADLRAIAMALVRGDLVQQIADALEKTVFDRLKALKNPAQFARGFIESKLKKEYFNNPYTFGGFSFKVEQLDYSTSVFNEKANIAIVVVHKESGIEVKAKGLYFKYRRPFPEPIYTKLTYEVPTDDLLAKALNFLKKEIPPIGPISISKSDPITVDPGKDGKGSSVSFTILIDCSYLEDVGLAKLPQMKVGVTVDSGGRVKVTGASIKIKLPTPIVLGNTSLLITSVALGLPARNKVSLGMTVSTVAGEESTLSADIIATVGFPILKEGIALQGDLKLNKEPLGQVKGFINKDRMTLSLTSDAITGGTGKLTIEGTLTRQGLDARAEFDSLLGLKTAEGQLHLGTDGNGSLSISSKPTLGGLEVDTNLSASFTPGFKNLVFKGAISIELPDEYLGFVLAEVDVSGQLLPGPKVSAWGHVGPLDLPRVEVANFNQLLDELKKTLLKERDQFYKFLADTESKASKYADQRTQVFSGWIYQNAKNIGLDKLKTNNAAVDKALGDLSQGAKDFGGAASQGAKDAVSDVVKEKNHLSDVASSVFGLRSATLSTGASGGFGLLSSSPSDKAIADTTKAFQNMERRTTLGIQLAPLTKSLDHVVVHREKSGHVGQIAGLRMRTSRVLSHLNGDHDADLTLLVQVTSFQYTIDPKKSLTGQIAHTNNLYVADVHLQGLADKNRKPTVEVTFPTLKNVAPWDAATLLRAALMKQIETKLGGIPMTDRFEERHLYLHNLTGEAITAHVQVETKTGRGWSWQPAGPGSAMKSIQITVPPHKIVPVRLEKGAIVQGRRARVWASSSSGRVWIPYATRDVLLVNEKDKEGHPGYYGRGMQSFRFWFAAPPAKAATFHERLVSVRNNTRYPVLVSAEVEVRNERGKLEWERLGPPTRIQSESTVALHHTHNLPLRGAAIRFQAEDEKKQVYRWFSARENPLTLVNAGGYSATTLGTTLLVLEPPGAKSSSVDKGASADVRLHFPVEQTRLSDVKGLPSHKARQLLEAKGFKVTSYPAAADAVIVSQIPPPGWEPFGARVVLSMKPTAEHSVLVKVPELVGKTIAEAKAEAKKAGLEFRVESTRPLIRETKNKELLGKVHVLSQNPGAGKQVAHGSPIEVRPVEYKLQTVPGTTVKVPSFKGMSLTEAEAAAKRLQLEVKGRGKPTVKQTGNRERLGKTVVEGQSHPAGQLVPKGTIVEVDLIHYQASSSSTTKNVRVPRLLGQTLTQAEEDAKKTGLKIQSTGVSQRMTKSNELANKTLVEEQSPKAGQEVPPGTTVTVHLARYVLENPSPAGQIKVPLFHGQKLEAAQAHGRRIGLLVKSTGKIVTKATSDKARIGETLIESQDPPEGRLVPRGATVEVRLVRYVKESGR